jgi:hypothetical protein
MHICAFPDDQFDVQLLPQKLNIILAEKGNLFLPEASIESIWLQILFTEKGSFTIFGGKKEIYLGNAHGHNVTTNPDKSVQTRPGEAAFDTQPQFIYVPEKQAWYCLTQGILVFPEEKAEIALIGQ